MWKGFAKENCTKLLCGEDILDFAKYFEYAVL